MKKFLTFLILVMLLFTFPLVHGKGSVEKFVKYTWEFLDEEYTLELYVGNKSRIEVNGNSIVLYLPQSRYDYYARLPGGYRIASNYSYFQYFVTPDDPYIKMLAEALNNLSKERGFDNLTEGNFILSFVQEIPYVDDYSATGFMDYYKFPLETLLYGGDCEDKSILLYTLLDILGYRAVLFVMEVHYMGVQGHVAVGVNIKNDRSPFSQFLRDYYMYQGRKYYYAESTGSTSISLDIGRVETIHYWIGISPEEAGIDIENLTILPVGNWHYSGYNPPEGLVKESVGEEGISWYLVILGTLSVVFTPLFIYACIREKKKCPRCGYPVEEDFSYCPNCGYWLGYLRPPPPPPP